MILIFVGITRALWFDSATEARREFVRETSILKELSVGLEADLTGVRGNLGADSITALTVFLDNSAPYEHLKVQGIDLIKDADLRQAIVTYHEHTVAMVASFESGVSLMHWQDQVHPRMLRSFRYLSPHQSATPVDYNALLEDVEYQNTLRYMGFVLAVKDILYQQISASARSLRERIEAELTGR